MISVCVVQTTWGRDWAGATKQKQREAEVPAWKQVKHWLIYIDKFNSEHAASFI